MSNVKAKVLRRSCKFNLIYFPAGNIPRIFLSNNYVRRHMYTQKKLFTRALVVWRLCLSICLELMVACTVCAPPQLGGFCSSSTAATVDVRSGFGRTQLWTHAAGLGATVDARSGFGRTQLWTHAAGLRAKHLSSCSAEIF